jgi:hypothetical protein
VTIGLRVGSLESIVCLSTLASHRATTCALRRSVSVKAATIAPAEPPCGIDAGAAVHAFEGEACDPQCAAAILRLLQRALEVAPECGA